MSERRARKPRKKKSVADLAPEVVEEVEQKKGVREETLDDFLRDNMQTTTHEKNGMPTLEWLHKTFRTKSARIRYLAMKGHKTKDIAKHLGIKYQMVRNITTNVLKRGPNESFDPDNPLPKFELPIKKPETDPKPVDD